MIAELRTLPELSGTPILLLSAKADDELKVKLLDDGAQDFIVKPFAEKDLLVRVRNLIEAHQALAQLDGLRSGRRERQSREGRVPRHARARAAQSVVADRHRAAVDEAAGARGIRARPRRDRASGHPPDAAGRRSSRRVEDRARQGRTESRSRRDLGSGREGDRNGEPAARAEKSHPVGPGAETRPAGGCRHHAAQPGDFEPADQRRQVHAVGRAHYHPWRGHRQ